MNNLLREKLSEQEKGKEEVIQKLTQKFTEFYNTFCTDLLLENQNLRALLRIKNTEDQRLKDVEEKIRLCEFDLEKGNSQSSNHHEEHTNDNNEDNTDQLKSMLEKAITDAKKRKNKKEHSHRIESENTSDSNPNVHLLPNKEAAHKNMKPKTTYLLGSPDDSEEDEEEEDEEEAETVISGVQSKYLL